MNQASISKSATIYLRGLDERCSKDVLKRMLYDFGQTFGTVIDVVVAPTQQMRGQAFLVFSESSEAAKVLEDINSKRQRQRQKQSNEGDDMMVLGDKLVAEYARTKSDATAKVDGTYRPSRDPKKQPPQHRIQSAQAYSVTAAAAAAAAAPALGKRQRDGNETEKDGGTASESNTRRQPLIVRPDADGETPDNKKRKTNGEADGDDGDDEEDSSASIVKDEPPAEDDGCTLTVENVPSAVPLDTIKFAFVQRQGFVRIERRQGSDDIAVTFRSQTLATAAKSALNGLRLTPTITLRIS
ncbi:hypothetical protein GQ42DRAFT_149548 [Ramicandelaber brevisporus]|nr:hypothetical protein GQ42DRAFT_149548 [Ramicandelaber brevisporus]